MNPAEAEVRRRIGEQRRITFAEFMDLALYHRPGGYYSSPGAVGAGGDFYTSPSAHPAFGALLCVQLHRLWQLLGSPGPFVAVEQGAGDGTLARDITRCAPALGRSFTDALVYVATDRFTPGRPAAGVQRIVSDVVPLNSVTGCFLSNELPDAMPVHRFEVRQGRIYEVYVALSEDGQLVEALDEPSTPELVRRLESVGQDFVDGHRGEVNLAIGPWIKEVSRALKRGFVLTIDYGHEAHELYSSRRSQGTLQTYFRHAPAGSTYQRIGRQDITSHVDFSAISAEGERAGLHTVGLTTQRDLLLALGFDDLLARTRESSPGQRERDANVMGLRELVKPGGLGDFGVLVQEKNTGVSSLAELAPDAATVARVPLPTLDAEHLALMEARYPHHTVELEHLWPFGDDDGT